jgi:hypothetical protein
MDARTKSRITHCICCDYPVTEKHHLLEQKKWQQTDSDNIVNLCPNCHQLYHLLKTDHASSLRNAYTIRELKKYRRHDVDFIERLIAQANHSERTLLEDLHG